MNDHQIPSVAAIARVFAVAVLVFAFAGALPAHGASGRSASAAAFGSLNSPAEAPYAAPSHRIVELGTLGGESSRAFGMNDRGWVVGHADDDAGRQWAVLWAESHVEDLGTLGGDGATALAVNDAGQVVGQSAIVPGQEFDAPETSTHAFLWEVGTMTDLGTLGGDVSDASDINASGQVVGASSTAPGQDLVDFFAPGRHPFLWQDGRMTDLGTLGGDWSAAFAVNDAGVVVGGAETADGAIHAALWRDGKITDLGTLGGDSAIAFAVNARDQVVGGSTTAQGQEFYGEGNGAFLWEGGRMTPLGSATGTDGIALAIDDRGEIVGEAFAIGAVRWEPGTVTSLVSLLGGEHPPLGIARAINAGGQIAGWTEGDDGARAFLLSPAGPTPAPLLDAAPTASPTPALAQMTPAEVVERSRRAVREAGSYRYETFFLPGSVATVEEQPTKQFIGTGEVAIGRGATWTTASGADRSYDDGRVVYRLKSDGTWRIDERDHPGAVGPLALLDETGSAWALRGPEFVDGRLAYRLDRALAPPWTGTTWLWIDAASFLPLALVERRDLTAERSFRREVRFADFGSPVDVDIPAAALAPTPTPEPIPATIGGRVDLVAHDIFFEPTTVAIPADTDVVLVITNDGWAPHNFSVDSLGISVDVDPDKTAWIIINAPPGEYTFHCAVPGHTEAGMVGTLSVGG